MIKGRNSFDWTPERCEQLRALWDDKTLPVTGIAKVLGVTRNVVIGKARRMHLSARVPNGWGGRASKPRKPLPRPAPIPVDAPIFAGGGGVRMVDLEFSSCRWPLWGLDGAPDGFLHCGHTKQPGASYCAAHVRMAAGAGTRSERRATS